MRASARTSAREYFLTKRSFRRHCRSSRRSRRKRRERRMPGMRRVSDESGARRRSPLPEADVDVAASLPAAHFGFAFFDFGFMSGRAENCADDKTSHTFFARAGREADLKHSDGALSAAIVS